MDIISIARKFIRFPWEVYDGKQHFKDEEIAASVAFDCGGTDRFKQPPSAEELPEVLQSIAIPVALSLFQGRGESLKKRNRWPTLTEEEKAFFLRTTCLNPSRHKMVLMLAVDPDWRYRMQSYIAAAYAFTTYTKPYVIFFDRLVQVAFNSVNGDPFEAVEMRNAGLLMVIGTGGPIVGAERVYGFLASLFNKRTMSGKMNMFVDVPDGAVLSNMMKETRVSRDDVVAMYQDIFPLSLRMHSYLYGPNVYIDPIDRMEKSQDERRQTIVI